MSQGVIPTGTKDWKKPHGFIKVRDDTLSVTLREPVCDQRVYQSDQEDASLRMTSLWTLRKL